MKFLIGPDGQAIMEEQGQPPIVPAVAGAGKENLPASLQVPVE